ncbi:hypothetical protein B0H14DRAFT_2532939 [Mycena olivaceomarginata]|nr:hypothetical protein B0H14DRAFT_2532939 [Mycena olivaceomarginata]
MSNPCNPSASITSARNLNEPIEQATAVSAQSEPLSPRHLLFPPSIACAPVPARNRRSPPKRYGEAYVPRPPNAFMLFRADVFLQQHVPLSIETNRGSLSKIIGRCWHALPPSEKHMWETKAKQAKAEHRLKYPYRFHQVNSKRDDSPSISITASKVTQGPLTPEEDERRCAEVVTLLLQGKKGDVLASAVRNLDWLRRGGGSGLEDEGTSAAPLTRWPCL